jgi:hypothetical protein
MTEYSDECIAKVNEFLEHHQEEPMASIGNPLRAGTFDGAVTQEWYKAFVEDQAMLFELVNAAKSMEMQQLLDLTCHQILRLLEGKSANEMRTILYTLGISQTDALITAFEWLTNFEVIRSHEEMEPDEKPDVLYALQLLLRLENPDLILFYDGTLGEWSSLYDWLMQACNPASKAALLIAEYKTGRLSSGLHSEETQRILCQDARFKNYLAELEKIFVLTSTWVAAYTPTVRGPPERTGGDFSWHCDGN